MERRYIKFDMNELARIAAQMVGSNRCVSVVKYPDGMYSKAFLLTMEDGKQVVAKVPNLNAGLAHFTTASEVATMDFVSLLLPSSSNFLFFWLWLPKLAREVCKTPSPKVFASSSKASENSVGAEYIVMEKIEGVPLSAHWTSMPLDKKTAIVKTLASYQRAWMSYTFKQYGSLYYANASPLHRDSQNFHTKTKIPLKSKTSALL
jgi:hypothetical protein